MPSVPTNIRVPDIAKAIEVYIAHAYGASVARHHPVPEIAVDAALEKVLNLFCNEARECPAAPTSGIRARYTLRLGNRGYPHMKLALEQAADSELFFFHADTHDQAVACTGVGDLSGWVLLQEENARIKFAIERAWYEAGLFTLRRLKEVQLAASGRFRVAPSADAATVLVVDDEPDAAQLLDHILSREGFRVRTASDGATALVMARDNPPDLVLLDYMMPDLSGREVCECLKGDLCTRDIPVMIATYADIDAAHLVAADAVLKKPFETRYLIERVRSLLAATATKHGA